MTDEKKQYKSSCVLWASLHIGLPGTCWQCLSSIFLSGNRTKKHKKVDESAAHSDAEHNAKASWLASYGRAKDECLNIVPKVHRYAHFHVLASTV